MPPGQLLRPPRRRRRLATLRRRNLHLDEGQQVRVELILGRADAGQAVRGWDRALDEALDEGKGGVGNLAPAAVDGEGVPAILHSSIAGL